MIMPEPRRWNGETPYAAQIRDRHSQGTRAMWDLLDKAEGYIAAMNSPTVQGLVEACKAYIAHVGGADIQCARLGDAALAAYNAGVEKP